MCLWLYMQKLYHLNAQAAPKSFLSSWMHKQLLYPLSYFYSNHSWNCYGAPHSLLNVFIVSNICNFMFYGQLKDLSGLNIIVL
jgi:hypothetical protein